MKAVSNTFDPYNNDCTTPKITRKLKNLPCETEKTCVTYMVKKIIKLDF